MQSLAVPRDRLFLSLDVARPFCLAVIGGVGVNELFWCLVVAESRCSKFSR